MTVIFKPYLAGIEHRIQEAARTQAKNIVKALKEAAYAYSAGCWNGDYRQIDIQNVFWAQAEDAHCTALLNAAQKDIESFAVARLKELAAHWETNTFKV